MYLLGTTQKPASGPFLLPEGRGSLTQYGRVSTQHPQIQKVVEAKNQIS